jgi:hypothetical protein
MRMVRTTRAARGMAAVVLALVAAPVLAACGDDGKAEPAATAATAAETVEQYGTRVNAQCPGGDPGFDSFMAQHPTPTAADWVAFLPSPRKMISDVRDCVVASHPPAVVADAVDAVVAALAVVVDDFDKALVAAKAGDLDKTNEWITQMHDIDQPKIDEAVAKVLAG